MAKQKTISVTPEEYYQLKEAKKVYQRKLGRTMDWGAFLTGLGLGFLEGCAVTEGFKRNK